MKEAHRSCVWSRSKKAEPVINQLCDVVDREGALKQAEEVQKKIDAGELTGPLAGVPVAIKDNMCIEGHAYDLQFQNLV